MSDPFVKHKLRLGTAHDCVPGRGRGRGMSTHRDTRSRKGRVAGRTGLVVLVFTILALAASPAALAADRGGPGALTVQDSGLFGVYLPVIRTAPLRFVSWSD